MLLGPQRDHLIVEAGFSQAHRYGVRCTVCGSPLLQMRRQDDQELSWQENPDSLKFFGKVANIACDHVFRSPFQSALKDLVVVGICGDTEVPLGVNNKSFLPDRLYRPRDLAGVEGKPRPAQHSLVFLKKGFRNDQREPSRKCQFEYQGFKAFALQVGGDNNVRVQDRLNGFHGVVPGDSGRSQG